MTPDYKPHNNMLYPEEVLAACGVPNVTSDGPPAVQTTPGALVSVYLRFF